MLDLTIQTITDNISILREDTLPVAFGGNKYRIAREYMLDMKNKGCDCLVGYGNIRSNLSRALSALCCMNKIPCYIISPLDDVAPGIQTFNSFLCAYSEAKYVYCTKTEVAETVERTMDMLTQKGYKPYYINGNKYGKGNELTPLKAYQKVYQQIKGKYDCIFLATGTGMTQSGLIIGKICGNGNEKIIGISVARDAEKEAGIIRNNLNLFFQKDVPETIYVDDTYRCGGYGLYDEEVESVIKMMWNDYAIPLDPTYTGKAYRGMLDYIKKHGIEDKRVLFIHTGGTPLFFDYMAVRRSKEKE